MRFTNPFCRRGGVLAAALVLTATATATTGLSDGAGAATAALPTAAGRWTPIPALVRAVDINNRGEVLGYDRDHRPVVWSPAGGGRTTVITTRDAIDLEDLTDDGTVVGYASAVYGPEPYGPFVWRAATGLTLIPQPTGSYLEVRGANDRGAVVGHFSFTVAGDPLRMEGHAYIWTAEAGMRDLEPGHPWSSGAAVNDRGVVTGTYADASDPGTTGFRWSAGRGFETLASLGGDRTEPSAVDSHGVIAGTASTADGTDHVVMWDGLRPTDLGTVGLGTTAVALNNHRTIAGAYLDEASGLRRSFRWTRRRGFEDLGFADRSASQELAGINDRGVIAVNAGEDVLGRVSGQVYLWRPATR
jgi:uncharacterized membrane protein